jgi:hypothetical protein
MTQTLLFSLVLGFWSLVLFAYFVRTNRAIKTQALVARVQWAAPAAFTMTMTMTSGPEFTTKQEAREYLSGKCPRHGLCQAPYCSDCIVESVSGLKIRSLSDILNSSL